MSEWLAITIGDVTGVGPEVTLKALAASDSGLTSKYLLIGDAGHIREANERFGTRVSLADWQTLGAEDRVAILQPSAEPLASSLAPGDPRAARAAVDALRLAAALSLSGECRGVVTAPVNKESIIRSGIPFVGQTELLSELAKTDRTAMMLLGEDDRGRWLRVALVTTHLPIRQVAEAITPAKVELAIELAANACGQLKLPRARVGVCGLNPHAGEGGMIGHEDQAIIAPAVERCRARELDVSGPFAADSLFYYAYKGDYDAVVAMYHDQGLAPLKMIGFESGINWTLGLPFIRTSPDHGTAYDIAQKGIANPLSMLAAMRLAEQLQSPSSPSEDATV